MSNRRSTKAAESLRSAPAIQAGSRSDRPTEVEVLINLKAYQIYLARGREPGRELEDWLLAEKEVMQKRIVTLEM